MIYNHANCWVVYIGIKKITCACLVTVEKHKKGETRHMRMLNS